MSNQIHEFTSTGAKLWHHQEVMMKLRNGQGQPIVSHIMPTDSCQHTCAFCSVATRDGNVLTLFAIDEFITQLKNIGLKAVIISGGGNPLLYKCPETRGGINELIEMLHNRGLEIGMICNGMPLKDYNGRKGWKTLSPEAMDKLTWLRISMSGLDHEENTVYVPDVDKTKTTLGFSYVYHDIYIDPKDTNHGKVSTVADLKSEMGLVRLGIDRIDEIREQIRAIVDEYKPAYVRLLPNCLEPDKIENRCSILQKVADDINPDVVFVQYKPPMAPNKCYLGYVHPVLNSDGYVYPCDSCVLNAAADHKFANPWRVCHGSKIGELYEQPIKSLVDSKALCPGCVFTRTNEMLEGIADGNPEHWFDLSQPEIVTHINFV